MGRVAGIAGIAGIADGSIFLYFLLQANHWFLVRDGAERLHFGLGGALRCVQGRCVEISPGGVGSHYSPYFDIARRCLHAIWILAGVSASLRIAGKVSGRGMLTFLGRMGYASIALVIIGVSFDAPGLHSPTLWAFGAALAISVALAFPWQLWTDRWQTKRVIGGRSEPPRPAVPGQGPARFPQSSVSLSR